MYARLALLALPLALAACDSQHMPWHKAEPVVAAAESTAPKPAIPEPTGAAPTEQALEVDGKRTKVATAQAETLHVSNFVAGGEGWTLNVVDSTAQFERAGAKAVSVKVQRIAYASGVEYIGTLNDSAFSAKIHGSACGSQPLTASVRANGKTFAGCATPGGAKITVAPKAAPKAAPKKAKAAPKAAAKPATPATPAVEPVTPPAEPAVTPTVEPATPPTEPTTTPSTTPTETPAATPAVTPTVLPAPPAEPVDVPVESPTDKKDG